MKTMYFSHKKRIVLRKNKKKNIHEGNWAIPEKKFYPNVDDIEFIGVAPCGFPVNFFLKILAYPTGIPTTYTLPL